MEWNIYSILFYLLLLDSLVAFYMAYSGKQHWWSSHMGAWARHFPLARGWVTVYLTLVIFIGIILSHTGLLVRFW